VSATASSPIAAVAALIEMLDASETSQLDHRHFRSQIREKNDLLEKLSAADAPQFD
jgi:hypothetical protein